MEFHFTNELRASRHDELMEYLRGPRLWISRSDYPTHLDWLHKTHGELRKGTKRAMVATDGQRIVGATVYQRHKEKGELLELKNITVRPGYEGRYVASFLLRNTEIEGRKEFATGALTVDAKARNVGIKSFLLRHGYEIKARKDLYGLGAGEDIIYEKAWEKVGER